jgi:hypothetical protein
MMDDAIINADRFARAKRGAMLRRERQPVDCLQFFRPRHA